MSLNLSKADLQLPVSSPDILLISAPLTISGLPFMAGPVLKPIAIKAGYSCSYIDINALTLKKLQSKDLYLKSDKNDLIKFLFYGQKTDKVYLEELDCWAQSVVDIIKLYNPKILGISVFTDSSRAATELILKLARTQLPDTKIIAGGHGIVKKLQKYGILEPVSFGEKLLRNGLIDSYIQGDAEHAFYEFLINNVDFPGINKDTWNQLTSKELLDIPYPDYSEVDWDLYPHKVIGITGSRGCVQNCKFCDYITAHPKYTFRTGQNIFDEMLHQRKTFGISSFMFSDSLVNGNLKEFKALLKLLVVHNYNFPELRIEWNGYFILRPKSTFGEDWWKLISKSGCSGLHIGIESFSETIRFEFGKTFLNSDIVFGLEMAQKYSVTILFLIFIGYPTETEELFVENLTWLDNNTNLAKVFTIAVTCTFELSPDTWLDRHKTQLNIRLDNPDDRQSWSKDDVGNTLPVRQQRRHRLIDHARKLGYTIHDEFGFEAMVDSIFQHQDDDLLMI